jgi:hypothetical protein
LILVATISQLIWLKQHYLTSLFHIIKPLHGTLPNAPKFGIPLPSYVCDLCFHLCVSKTRSRHGHGYWHVMSCFLTCYSVLKEFVL